MILKILFIIFIAGLLIVAFTAAKIIAFIKEGARQFREQANGGAYRQPHQSHRRDTGQTVVDRRDADEVNKKIFKKDEGEYVDFEEETIPNENRQ